MKQPSEPIFLERHGYRQRRAGDAARLLPFLGGLIFCLPLLWGDAARTAGGILFLFSGWALMIVASAVLARGLSKSIEASRQDQDEV